MVKSDGLDIDKTKQIPEPAKQEPTPGAISSAAEKDGGAVTQQTEKSPPAAAVSAKDDKKVAKSLHTGFNFFGLHLVGNSALSLFITYNIAPLKQTQKILHGLADCLTPVVSGYDKLKGAVGLSNASKLNPQMRAFQIKQSARSATETAVMCIAGSLMLGPVMFWENRRGGIVEWTDNLLHPGKKKKREAAEAEAKKNGTTLPEQAAEPEHKETWGNLIRARLIALVPIFWIDGQIQGFNNGRIAAGKPNVDTFLWEKGAKIYDNMKPSTRDSFINFFSRKGHNVESIQPLLRESLTKTVGSNPSRMIAAEQFRMLSKEVYLTAIYTGFLYVLGKTPIVPWTMEKLGISKRTEHNIEEAIDKDVGLKLLPVTEKPANPPDKSALVLKEPAKDPSFAKRVNPKPATIAEPIQLYTKKLAAQELHEGAVAWDRSSA